MLEEPVERRFAAREGAAIVGRVYYDTLAEPVLGVRNCTDVVAMAGCQPDVEVHCLECVDEGEVMPLECVAQ